MPYADPKSSAAVASAKARARRTYYKNQEKNIARSRAYNLAHMEHILEWNSQHRSTRLPPSKVLYNNAKNRAKAQGLEFNLTVDDLIVPALCPVLGIPLVVATGHSKDNSPSVDRVDCRKGYVKGNIIVMSHKANTMKSNATLEELRLLLAFMEKLCAQTG